MHSLIRLAILTLVVLVGYEVAHAGVNLPAAASPAVAATAGVELPLVLGQTTNDSSSSSSARIPRGAIKLAIFVGIALFGAAGWVFKKMTAG